MVTPTPRHGPWRCSGSVCFAPGTQAPRGNHVAAERTPRQLKRLQHVSAIQLDGKLALTTTLWTPSGRSVRCTLWRKSARTPLDS
jgi:hypothetical protein